MVADGVVLDLGRAAQGGEQLGQKLELPHSFARATGVEHVRVVVVVLEQDVPHDLVLREDAARRVVRSIFEKAARAAGVDAERRHPAESRAKLAGSPRQRRDRDHIGQDDVVVHECDQRPVQILEQLQAAAGKGAVAVSMELVLAADIAILGQAQHRHDVDALDRRLVARIDHENLDRVLLLENQVGDDDGQHRPTLGQNANLNPLRRGVSQRHCAWASPKSSSSWGRTTRSACSDSGVILTFCRM